MKRKAHKVSWTNYGRKYYFRKTFTAEKIRLLIVGRMIQ